jgi:hypothetical protein
MITDWLTPSNIAFIPDPSNSNSPWNWTATNFPIVTTKNMRRISLHDIATTAVFSDALVLSGFKIPAYTTLLGMQIIVDARRNSRITDYIVQPFNGSAVYNNLANQDGSVPNEIIYGSPTELWGIPNTDTLTSNNFGIYLQVGPHPLYNGSDEAIVDRVAVKLYYQ